MAHQGYQKISRGDKKLHAATNATINRIRVYVHVNQQLLEQNQLHWSWNLL